MILGSGKYAGSFELWRVSGRPRPLSFERATYVLQTEILFTNRTFVSV